MDNSSESIPISKNQKPNKWNPFQRGGKTKSSANLNVLNDPAEWQRVSFATSIDDLPERPSAFKQVLRQIGGNKMKRVHSFKKLTKDVRSNSPQGRLSVGNTPSGAFDAITNGQRPRSSSHSSYGTASDTKGPGSQDELLSSTPNDRVSSENRSVSSVQTAGALLQEQQQPSSTLTMSDSLAPNSSNLSFDAVDGLLSSGNDSRSRYTVELEHLQQKVLKISEAIKLEQTTRDENVREYLKLAENADKQQASRIKSVFEKKNQKSNNTIAQLQKKLDSYHRRLKELDNNGGKQGRSALRDLGANMKQATQNAAGAIVSKPKDIAFKLKNKFGSVDNLSSMRDEDDNHDDYTPRYGSADDVSSTSESVDYGASSTSQHNLDGNSPAAAMTICSDSPTGTSSRQAQQILNINSQMSSLQAELRNIGSAQAQFESEWQKWKDHSRDEIGLLTGALREERFRCDNLETQLNNLTELHQHEISVLKQELSSMEEKVEYHALARARDMQEAVENCQTRLAKMELQQQQMVAVEGLENANARALLGKLINLLLSVLAVLLVFVSTFREMITPLTRSPVRILASLVVIVAAFISYNRWNAAET